MFTLFVLALIVIGVVAAVLIGMIKQNRAEIMELKRHIQRLEARFDGVILPFLMDRISRIKCSSMAAYHRWLDEAFHDYRTTTNGWHNPEYHLSC